MARPRRPWAVPALAALLGAALLLALAGAAEGHAKPRRTAPLPGQVLDAAPSEVRIEFTETVDPSTLGMKVLDGSLGQVDRGQVSVSGDRFVATLPLPPGLADGPYVVQWQTVSAADGHLTKGSFGFAVGSGSAAPQGAVSEVEVPAFSWGAFAGKAMAFLGLAVVSGSTVFRDGVLAAAARERHRPWLARLGLAGTAVLAVGVGVLMVAQQHASGVAAGAWLATDHGRFLALRLGAALALLGWLGVSARRPRPGPDVPGVALLAVIWAVQGAASHTAGATRPLSAGLALDAVHVAAVSAWTGGLVCLAVFLARQPVAQAGDQAALREAAVRFSGLALACVAALTLSGVVMTDVILGLDPAQLVHRLADPYVQLLGAKVGLAVLAIALGGLSRFVYVARYARGEGLGQEGRWRRVLGREVAVAAAVFVLAAALTNVSPAVPAEPAEGGPGAAPTDLALLDDAATYRFRVDVAPPPQVGVASEFTVRLTALDTGAPETDATRVRLVLEHQEADLGATELTARPAGNGTYLLNGSYIQVPGPYRLTVFTQTPRTFRDQVRFEFEVPPGGPAALPAALEQTRVAAGVNATILATPNPPQAGRGSFDVHVTDARGLQAQNVTSATLLSVRPGGEAAPSLALAEVFDGHFAAEGPVFDRAGEWVVEVVLRFDDGREVRFDYPMVVRGP